MPHKLSAVSDTFDSIGTLSVLSLERKPLLEFRGTRSS